MKKIIIPLALLILVIFIFGCTNSSSENELIGTWEYEKSEGTSTSLVIDKDIKCREFNISPAIYSPQTISFITTQQNAEEANAKAVFQFDLEGNMIAKHISCTQAAISLGKNKTSKSSIANCARGIQNTAFGFKWKYK